MPGRIVLFGATGYTGRLTAAALMSRVPPGTDVVLAGRDERRLASLASDLAGGGGSVPSPGLSTAQADATDPRDVARLIAADDVLVTTVGPFTRLGWPAVHAAAEVGAGYLDSTGEPPFLLRIFRELGPLAVQTGARLLPAFGDDYVPGNLAGALALRDAGPDAVKVEVGYFIDGEAAMSGGTLASSAGVLLDPGPRWHDGELRTDRPAARVAHFQVRGRSRSAISIGGSEHLTLPSSFRQVRDVDVFLGWTGSLSRVVQVGSAAGSLTLRLPGAKALLDRTLPRVLRGSGGGPDERQRSKATTVVVAHARSGEGELLSRVALAGPSPYDLTAELLAWGAVATLDGHVRHPGACGPVDAFGLDELEGACAVLGLQREDL